MPQKCVLFLHGKFLFLCSSSGVDSDMTVMKLIIFTTIEYDGESFDALQKQL